MGEKRPYFGKGQVLGLTGLVLSYVIAWYCYVLTASNDSACSIDLASKAKCVRWYKPTKTQWFGLLVTIVIAILSFLTFWLNVQGAPDNLDNEMVPLAKMGIGASFGARMSRQ